MVGRLFATVTKFGIDEETASTKRLGEPLMGLANLAVTSCGTPTIAAARRTGQGASRYSRDSMAQAMNTAKAAAGERRLTLGEVLDWLVEDKLVAAQIAEELKKERRYYRGGQPAERGSYGVEERGRRYADVLPTVWRSDAG